MEEAIDKRKRKSPAVRGNASQLQERHELILASAGEGIYGLDHHGRITFGNPAAARILGWRIEDIKGSKAHAIHHHSHADGSNYPVEDCPIYAALKDGKVHHVEHEVFWHADGSAIPVEYTSTPILEGGKPHGAVVVFRDVTKRRALEQESRTMQAELERLKMQYQLILDAAGEGIYGLDAEGRLTFGNKAAEQIVGWKTDTVIGRKSHDIHHHSTPDGSPYPHTDCPIYHALSDGAVHRVDNEVFWHADGSAVPVEYTSTPIFHNGKPDGAVVVFRDITQRRLLESQRRSAFDEIQSLKEQLEQERDYLRDEINVTTNFGEIVGASKALKEMLSQIEAVSGTPANVLVLGESGVGKEMVARAIHGRSDRAEKALVKVNCASIPHDLFESEFFGHVRGAFTGALRDRVGRLQLADGGTLFLDEVGEIPMSQQGKLLRALQEHEFERVGDDKTAKVDVRVVAATNRDLKLEVAAGRFREDLYYRLCVFPIEVPPLRQRKSDIAPLAKHFLQVICQDLGREPFQLSQREIEQLQQYQWPGNIRELKNIIERAVISSPGTRLRIERVLADIVGSDQGTSAQLPLDDGTFITDADFRKLERENIIKALKEADWRVWGDKGAAELLGIKPSTLTYRMKMFEIRKDRA